MANYTLNNGATLGESVCAEDNKMVEFTPTLGEMPEEKYKPPF
jgi:hypothetical protein